MLAYGDNLIIFLSDLSLQYVVLVSHEEDFQSHLLLFLIFSVVFSI